MESQFCLRWNNFSSSMTSALHKLHQGEDFVDVTIAADGVQMKAHKVILSACSPYFKSVLKSNPCQHPVIILKEASFEDLASVLTFIYEGEVNVTQPRLHTFMRLAETLQVRGLTDSHNAPESHSSNSKVCDGKFSSSLDLTTRKRRYSSSNRIVSLPRVSGVATVRSAAKRSNQIQLDEQPSSLSKHREPQLMPEQASKRKKYTGLDLVVPRSSSMKNDAVGSKDITAKNMTSDTDLLEIKTEHPERDCQESKENGDGATNILNGGGYHLRHTKPRSPSSDGAPSLPKEVDEEELLTSADSNQPVLTIPQRSALDDSVSRLTPTEKQSHNFQPEFPQDYGCSNLPFPCPFCDKSYTSWGFRRRHIKGFHTGSPQLPCKWCFDILPTHHEWESHVTNRHNLGVTEARNGLLILDEAHMVLQISQPTRIDSLVEIIKNKKCKEKEEDEKNKLMLN